LGEDNFRGLGAVRTAGKNDGPNAASVALQECQANSHGCGTPRVFCTDHIV
jgi:hypothetical protein